MALAEAGPQTKIWQRIVRNAQIMLHVDGCSYYRRDGEHLRCVFLMSSALGVFTEDENSVPDIVTPIALYDDDGKPNLRTIAGRVVHSGLPENIPNVTHLRNYSESRTRAFDEQMGYRTQSILSVPVRYRHEPVSGVMQLVNAHNAEGELVEFDEDRLQLAAALAGTIALAQQLNPPPTATTDAD